MAYEVRLHPRVQEFLDSLSEKERNRCVLILENLKDGPFKSRSGADIKKLKGKLRDLFRLRVGEYRFEYFFEENIVWVTKSFRRGHGY
ncbi:MAG: type II toxin-antitoxin system RelE/ParE family toxin [Candidatus Aenigmarchaeota archaeon]|nr:type II toxin-antitoxin system RelE/ParE family toxin [Candidatus Aenigmarchaeota archaeon]